MDDENRVEFTSEESEEETRFIARLEKNIRFSLVKFLRKTRIARTDIEAYYIILVASIVLFVLAMAILAYFVFGIGKKSGAKYIVPEQFKNVFPPEIQQKINASS